MGRDCYPANMDQPRKADRSGRVLELKRLEVAQRTHFAFKGLFFLSPDGMSYRHLNVQLQ